LSLSILSIRFRVSNTLKIIKALYKLGFQFYRLDSS